MLKQMVSALVMTMALAPMANTANAANAVELSCSFRGLVSDGAHWNWADEGEEIVPAQTIQVDEGGSGAAAYVDFSYQGREYRAAGRYPFSDMLHVRIQDKARETFMIAVHDGRSPEKLQVTLMEKNADGTYTQIKVTCDVARR